MSMDVGTQGESRRVKDGESGNHEPKQNDMVCMTMRWLLPMTPDPADIPLRVWGTDSSASGDGPVRLHLFCPASSSTRPASTPVLIRSKSYLLIETMSNSCTCPEPCPQAPQATRATGWSAPTVAGLTPRIITAIECSLHSNQWS